MKILRYLPEGVGEPVETSRRYERGNTVYIVQHNEAGRMIYTYEREETTIVDGSEDVSREEEVQQQGEGEQSSPQHSESTGEQSPSTHIPMSRLQEVPLDNHFPEQAYEMSCCNIPLGEDRVCPGCLEIC